MRLEEFLSKIQDLITYKAQTDWQLDLKKWIVIAGLWHGLFNIARYGSYMKQEIYTNKLLCLSRLVEYLEYIPLIDLTKPYRIPEIANEIRKKMEPCIKYVEPRDLDTLYEYAESYEREFW